MGWAAGGEVIDVVLLRDKSVRRWQRWQRITRSVRIQNLFAIFSVGLICFSFVFGNQGLGPFITSLDDVSAAVGQIQSRTRHGMHLAHLLSSHMVSLRPFLDFNISKVCPNHAETILESEFSLDTTSTEIISAGKQLDYFMENDLDPFLQGVDQVAETCKTVDSAISSARDNDWIIRLFLVAVNVINIFFIFGVMLTRNKINFPFYQDVLGIFFVPAFSATLVFAVAAMCLIAVTSMINAGMFISPDDFVFVCFPFSQPNSFCPCQTFAMERRGTHLTH